MIRAKEPFWRRYLRFWGTDIASDVDDEVRFHMEMRIADYVRAGKTPEESRRLAEERFGDSGFARTECVRIQRTREKTMARSQWLDGFNQDIRFAWRVLRRQPLPTAASVFCLILGIGASTSMFSVADTMLRRPLPFPNGDQLVTVRSLVGKRTGAGVMSVPDIADLRARQRTFSEFGAASYTSLTWLHGEPTRVTAAVVTAGLFNALGVHPQAGRLLVDSDDRAGAERVTVVSQGFADRWFGGASGALDKSMNLGGKLYRVVGVLPDIWRYPDRAEVFVANAADSARASRGNRFLTGIGVLKAKSSLTQARNDAERVAGELRHEFADDNKSNLHFAVDPLRSRYVSPARSGLLTLSAATILVLLIACANVAGLQLARATARHREIALRTAIGAQRSRVLRQLLTESVMLALVSGAGGCLFAWWGSRLIGRAVAQSAPAWMTFTLDPMALAFAVLVSMAAGIAFGIVPALRLGKLNPSTVLRGGRVQGPERGRTQRMFVIAEIALSTMLLVGTGLALQSVRALSHIPLGFDPANVMTFRVTLQGSRYDSASARASTISELTERLAALPNVQSAGAVTRLPVSGCCSQFGVKIEGREGKDDGLMMSGNMITPDYLKTMGISLHKGRGILPTDIAGGRSVVLINETFAKLYWNGDDAIGRRISVGDGWSEIVGIVSDVKQNTLIEGAEPQFYRPHRQNPWDAMTFVVRLKAGDPTSIAPMVRQQFRDVDATQPVYSFSTMTEQVQQGLNTERVLSRLLTAFAIVALILAASGVYAAMSFFVSQRTQELGVRMALGADRWGVLRLVLSRSVIIAATGLTVGLVAALVSARTVAHQLYGADAANPWVYVVAAVAMVLSTTLATLGPSRRAVSVDPMSVLRGD